MKIDINSIRNHIHTLANDKERFEYLNKELIRIMNIEMNGLFIPLIERNAIPQKNIVSKTDDGKILAFYETKKIPKEEESEYFNNKFALMELREYYRAKVEKENRAELIKQTANKYKLIEWAKGLHLYAKDNPPEKGKGEIFCTNFLEKLKEHNKEYSDILKKNRTTNDGRKKNRTENDIRETFTNNFQRIADKAKEKKRNIPTHEEIEMFLHS